MLIRQSLKAGPLLPVFHTHPPTAQGSQHPPTLLFFFPYTSANRSRVVGSRRTRGFDCLTEPGLVCLPIAVRPKQSPMFHGAMGKLYEAGEGVSKPRVRREPATRPIADKEISPPTCLASRRGEPATRPIVDKEISPPARLNASQPSFTTPCSTPQPQPVYPPEPAPRSQDLRPKTPSMPSAHAAAFPDRRSG